MNPLVSILIPVYNREYLVGETIESAINQTYTNIEIIIVDNCSTDGTWGVLQKFAAKYSRIKIFQNYENVGPVLNWKRCVDEASGDYLKILFSDDLMDKDFVEKSMEIFDDSTAFVLSAVSTYNESRVLVKSTYQNNSEYTRNDYLDDILLYNLHKFPVSPGAGIFRKLDIEKNLLVDIQNDFGLNFNRYGAGNDLLVFLRTALNYKVIKTVQSQSFFRAHDSSFSISNDLQIYYDFSRYLFIKNNFPKILGRFKALLWMRKIRTKIESPIFKLIEANTDFMFLFFLMRSKLIIKFRNYSVRKFHDN